MKLAWSIAGWYGPAFKFYPIKYSKVLQFTWHFDLVPCLRFHLHLISTSGKKMPILEKLYCRLYNLFIYKKETSSRFNGSILIHVHACTAFNIIRFQFTLHCTCIYFKDNKLNKVMVMAGQCWGFQKSFKGKVIKWMRNCNGYGPHQNHLKFSND